MYICKKIIACFIILLLPFISMAQENQIPLTVSVFSNATNLPTRPAYLFAPVHPGIAAGTAFRYNKSTQHQLAQTAKIGFFHHRYMHNILQLYSEFTYKYAFKNGLDIGPAIGIGYAHAFSAVDVFKKNSNGEYEKQTNWGRPQFMATTAVELGYNLSRGSARPFRVFTNYQFWLQTPFVNSYVPLLPNTSLHIGVSMPLKWSHANF